MEVPAGCTFLSRSEKENVGMLLGRVVWNIAWQFARRDRFSLR